MADADGGSNSTAAEAMSANPAELKAGLRRQMREALKNFSPAQRAADSEKIRQLLQGQSRWINARAVLLFVPLASEPDIRPLLAQALADGKVVALPRFSTDSGIYQPAQLRDSVHDLRPGPFGVLEPDSARPIIPANQLDFALVPGIGFSLVGGRLGRGQGHYDRLLAEVSGFKCGVAFDCQVADRLPMEPHDVRLNCILTPARWHVVSPAPVLK
jgi:5-formyltetrahydrofolate cyclo-ligase